MRIFVSYFLRFQVGLFVDLVCSAVIQWLVNLAESLIAAYLFLKLFLFSAIKPVLDAKKLLCVVLKRVSEMLRGTTKRDNKVQLGLV